MSKTSVPRKPKPAAQVPAGDLHRVLTHMTALRLAIAGYALQVEGLRGAPSDDSFYAVVAAVDEIRQELEAIEEQIEGEAEPRAARS